MAETRPAHISNLLSFRNCRLLQAHMNFITDHLKGKYAQRHLTQWSSTAAGTQIKHHSMQRAGNHAIADASAFKSRVLVGATVFHCQIFTVDIADQYTYPLDL